MRIISLLSLLALSASAASATPVPAPGKTAQKVTVAVIPAQWFSANHESAQRLTEGDCKEFVARGWRVLPQGTVQRAARAMALKNGVHYLDPTTLRLGRRVHADFVVYPRLLALGLPVAASTHPALLGSPAAVVLVRVPDVKRKQAVYCNQIAHEFNPHGAVRAGAFALPAAEGRVAVTEALGCFFTSRAGRLAALRGAQARQTPKAAASAAPELSAPTDGTAIQPPDVEHR